MVKLIAACLGLAAAFAAAAVRAELRPVGLARVGPRDPPPRARHVGRPVVEAADRRGGGAAGPARGAGQRSPARALDGDRPRGRSAGAGARLHAGAAPGRRRPARDAGRGGDGRSARPHPRRPAICRPRQRGAAGRGADAVGGPPPSRRASGPRLRARGARLPTAAGALHLPRPVRALAVVRRARAPPADRGAPRPDGRRVARAGVARRRQPARRWGPGAQRAVLEPLPSRVALEAGRAAGAQPRGPRGGAACVRRRGGGAGTPPVGGARARRWPASARRCCTWR